MQNIWRGDAPNRAQILTVASPGAGNIDFLIGGRRLGFAAAWNATSIANLWNASPWQEFRAINAVVSGANVVLTSRTSGKPFEIVLTQAGTPVTSSITLTQESRGSAHWDDPDNWSLGHVPSSDEEVTFEFGTTGPRYGLRQRSTFTVNTGSDKTITNGHFRNGQIVRLTSTGALPGGLATGTDYTIANVDRVGGLLELQVGGVTVDITSAGTGTHTLSVEPSRILLMSTFSGPIGLPLFDDAGYKQYLPTDLQIGLATDGIVTVGQHLGSGSSFLRLNTGGYLTHLEVLRTAGGTEQGAPALVWTGSHPSNRVELIDGEIGVNFFAHQSGSLSKLIQRSGECIIGEETTFPSGAVIDKTGGELTILEGTVDGVLHLRG